MVIWQDVGIMTISASFSFLLLPQLHDVVCRGRIVNLWTAISTGVGILLLGGIYLTMGLWLSVITQVMTALVWMLIALFSIRNQRGLGLGGRVGRSTDKPTSPHVE